MACVRAVLTVAAAIALPALAQTSVPPSPALSKAARAVITVPGASIQTVHVPRGSRAEGRATPAGARLAAGALSSFDLRFLGSDHKLRMLGIELHAPNGVFRLADRDPQDPFTGSASWLQAPYFRQLTEVKARGGGDFLIDIPPGPAGHVPLLAGFAFERMPGTDANIRTVAVQIVGSGRQVRVALRDDQGADFRDFAPDVHGSIGMSGIPLVGGILAATYMSARTAQEYGLFDGKRLRLFDVRVQIVWAPRAAVLGMGSASGMSRRADGGTMPGTADKVALRGFRFMFGNSDHHLKAIAVRLQAGGRTDPVAFQDNEADDPIAWSVDYARMR